MTNQVLTTAVLSPDAAATDLTAGLTAATQTTVQFTSAGHGLLLVTASTGTPTVTLNVGTTILGQAVAAFTPFTLTTANHLYAFGPFHSALQLTGTNTVTVTLSTITGVTLSYIQLPGVQ